MQEDVPGRATDECQVVFGIALNGPVVIVHRRGTFAFVTQHNSAINKSCIETGIQFNSSGRIAQSALQVRLLANESTDVSAIIERLAELWVYLNALRKIRVSFRFVPQHAVPCTSIEVNYL